MKGAIFKHLQAFVEGQSGEDLWEEILDGTQLRSELPFLGPADYPDQDLESLVASTIARLGIPLEDALRAFGRFLFDRLAEGAPQFVRACPDLKGFLATVDGVIHVEVKKLTPTAYLPSLRTEDLGADGLRMHYASRRRLCRLFLGLVEGAAAHYGHQVQWQEPACQHAGAEACCFEFHFPQAA